MSLFDFFFPEQAQAAHLRTIANATRLEKRRRLNRKAAAASAPPTPPPSALEQRITALEADVGFASLVLAAVMARLDERGVVTKSDVRALVDEIDGLDGVKDGRLDVSILRATHR
jgi:hypothetical protein